jgi:glycerol-3-phosphate dehydrogenase (NAD(P)+)
MPRKALKTKSRYGAKTPIIDAVYEILYEGKDARAVFKIDG